MDAANSLAKGFKEFEQKLGPQFEGLPCGGADFVVAQNSVGKFPVVGNQKVKSRDE
jgi:hypothetical protein